jgi:hypothetical protein
LKLSPSSSPIRILKCEMTSCYPSHHAEGLVNPKEIAKKQNRN